MHRFDGRALLHPREGGERLASEADRVTPTSRLSGAHQGAACGYVVDGICGIVLCVALLIAEAARSRFFFLAYALAGLTDVLVGCVARGANSESEPGARLDSFADLVLAVACLARMPAASRRPDACERGPLRWHS